MKMKSIAAASSRMVLRASKPTIILSLIIAIVVMALPAAAQCLVSNLNISTGYYNGAIIPTGTNDPNWRIESVSAATLATPSGYTYPRQGRVVARPSYWGPLTGSQWLSIDATGASPGYAHHTTGTLYTCVFARTFNMCSDGEVRIDLTMLNDNYIPNITIDASPFPGSFQSFTTGGANATTTFVKSYTVSLSAGMHTIRITVENAPVPPLNPTGLIVSGTVTETSGNAILVNDMNPNCADYVCDESPCNDKCYWRVVGNNIAGSNNIFGTLNDFDVRIQTNSSDRGILTPGGPNNADPNAGRMGWNTMNPTARLHVDCQYGNNWDNAPNATSDIRFENLEPGSGTILVIDDMGYVYNSRVPLQGADGAMKTEIEQLKIEVAELKAQVASYRGAMTQTGNVLYQNAPTPFGKETVIGYDLQTMQQAAYIIIYDLTGREMMKYPAAKGKGQVTISGEKLQPGMYLYSLIVDGKEADTKRMVVSK